MPLPPVTDAFSARKVLREIEGRLRAEGVEGFREPPEEPTSCCGRGCEGCVWEGYFAAVGWWRDDALALLEGTRAVPKPRSKPPTKEKTQVAFGAAVRARREALSLTQEQLAELADLHTNYVSSVERGERNIGLHNLARLAYALDLPVSVLTSCLDPRSQ